MNYFKEILLIMKQLVYNYVFLIKLLISVICGYTVVKIKTKFPNILIFLELERILFWNDTSRGG